MPKRLRKSRRASNGGVAGVLVALAIVGGAYYAYKKAREFLNHSRQCAEALGHAHRELEETKAKTERLQSQLDEHAAATAARSGNMEFIADKDYTGDLTSVDGTLEEILAKCRDNPECGAVAIKPTVRVTGWLKKTGGRPYDSKGVAVFKKFS